MNNGSINAHCAEVPIPFTTDRFGSQLSSATLDKNLIYRFCEREDCAGLFDAGERTCVENINEFPARCPAHRALNRFACPQCGQILEYAGGCLSFTCCIYGTDRCEGRTCDHGGLCGYSWRLKQEQAVLTGHAVQ